MTQPTADEATRARSFGSIAEDYDRLRPPPPPQAVSWLLPPGAHTVLDLAAGTGLLTRALLAAGVDVVAVEPDDRMRAVLAERSPGVRALAGVAEEVPLPDASVDAVLVSSAWHWVDPARAVPEVARVLRDGGRFGAVWTSRDREVGWVRELDLPRLEDAASGTARTPGGEHREVVLPPGSPFGAQATTEVASSRRMAPADVVAMVGTYSQVITGSPESWSRTAQRLGAVLAEHFPGAVAIDVPVRSHCWRADRLPR